MRNIVHLAAIWIGLVSQQVGHAQQLPLAERMAISEALEAIALCYHWAEEVGEGNAERQKQIAEGLERDCPVSAKMAKRAVEQFPGNAELSFETLRLVDIGYFDDSSEMKAKLCSSAFPHYRALGAKDAIYKDLCSKQAEATR